MKKNSPRTFKGFLTFLDKNVISSGAVLTGCVIGIMLGAWASVSWLSPALWWIILPLFLLGQVAIYLYYPPRYTFLETDEDPGLFDDIIELVSAVVKSWFAWLLWFRLLWKAVLILIAGGGGASVTEDESQTSHPTY